MPDYTPPPADLSRLNPIQRYMQKGSLDFQDYVYLIIFVAAYFAIRPFLQKFFQNEPEIAEGERERDEYNKRRAQAKISPNAIRGTEPDSVLVGEKEGATGRITESGGVVNRKGRPGQKLVLELGDVDGDADKEWEEEPQRKAVEGDKNDVVAWLERWEKEED